ncbi:CooT family nickel-binding protein [Candidatus Bathyarchaeota archaeon]|nr:CooT family nickel-binding protein [Candidatus Bathyarchaeota archaeon]MBS7613236.1 CooT family nickel-binding protein [Candidatus Bathyarchaeota archaeon]MBS7618034.1 CooT family nickel-binding protein [Candidatus Bathyarchaeota archaeon]
MCLLKVYLDDGVRRKLIATDVALIMREEDGFRLRFLEPSRDVLLRKAMLQFLDALNSLIVFKALE